jgi:putative spermidine/putrescine transport system substrate-binding protein
VASQFPAEVQPLLGEIPDNLVQLLWEIRQQGPDTLVWLTPGGEFHEASKRAFLDNWAAITGWTVTDAPAVSGYLAALEEQVNAGSPEWDVANIGEYGLAERMAAQNLFEPLDLQYFPVDVIPDTARMTENYAEIAPYFTVLVWNTEVFPEGSEPQSVLDLFNTTDFPGKRCIWDGAEYGWNLEYALMADGVGLDEAYDLLATPEGRARAFAKLDTIRDDLVFWSSGAESLQFVLDGQCDLGTTWANRVATRLKEEPDLPLAMTWQDAIGGGDPWIVPRGAPHARAALSALAYAVQPASQCRLLNESGQGIIMDAPPFPDCLTDFALEWGPKVDQLAGSEDAEFWFEFADEYLEEWTAWKAGG